MDEKHTHAHNLICNKPPEASGPNSYFHVSSQIFQSCMLVSASLKVSDLHRNPNFTVNVEMVPNNFEKFYFM